MRILQITDGIPPLVLGGTGNIVRTVSAQLRQRGHDVSLVYAQGPAAGEEDGVRLFKLDPLPKRWAHFRSVFSTKRGREILDIIEQVKPDIIHAHTIAFQCGYAWIREARRRGYPVVVSNHDVMNIAGGRVMGDETRFALVLKDLKRLRWTWNPLRAGIVLRLLNRNANRILCVSDALAAFMRRFGYPNVETLHNGVDVSFWKEAVGKNAARAKRGLPQDTVTFLLAGRLGVDKGSDAVAATLPDDAYLILAGAADMKPFSKIADRVRLFPNQSPQEMRELYEAADVVLVPSICLDCYPTVCLEAAAMGRPVIATTLGGAKEAVEDGVTGWLVDPRDSARLAAVMQDCVAHPEKRESFGRSARQRAQQHFDVTRYVDSLLSVYASCLASPSAS